MNEPLLTVQNLKIGVPGTEILHDLSFEVHKGETVVVIGSNGAGKSMLIKTIMGLMKPLGGTFWWSKKPKIGYVPQKFSLPRHVPLSGIEFLALKPNASSAEIDRVLALVELPKEVALRSVQALSGGQFQRLLIAWALLDKPDVVVFDEPTESIDVRGQESIYSLIHDLTQKEGVTTFLVTHDLDIVHRYASRVICLARGTLVCSTDPKSSLSEHILADVFGKDQASHHHH